MKFPTATPLFPPVTLSPQECARYEQLAQGLVLDTLADYDLYRDIDQRRVSKQLWKPVKARENITVYKDRHYDPDDNLHRGLASGISISSGLSSSSQSRSSASISSIGEYQQQQQQNQRAQSQSVASSSSSGSSSLSTAILDSIPAEEWNLPKLLMVGTVSGTLDDVMYGLATPDPGLMLLKAHYAADEVIDGQVLAQIQGPTPTEPYRFLGLKWLVKGNPAAVSALVMPRDLILLETTGIMSHPKSGERIGYFLMHSVNLHGCPELPKKAAVRGRISSCYIFKELGNGVVDVYMKGFVEASGKIADAVAIISAANGLLCCWKAVVCSQSKKLVWALKTRLRESKRCIGQMEQAHLQSQQDDACGMCSKTFKRYNRVACCQLCDGSMCSRCRVTMKLAFPRVGEKEIRLKNVTVCKGCIASSNQQSTFEVAQREVLSGRFGAQYTTAASLSTSVSAASVQRQSTYSSVSSLSSGNSSGGVASNKRSTVISLTSQRSNSNPDEILLAQAQEYARSSVPGSGSTILLAHAQDRAVANKSTRGKTVSRNMCYKQSNSMSSTADTTKSSMASDNSEFNSNYSSNSYFSEGGASGYESFDDLPPRPSEDDDGMFRETTTTGTPDAVDIGSVVTSDWSAVSPTSRQQYLDSVQGRTPEEQAMWKRMAQLHLQAENLYQFTKRNTATVMQTGIDSRIGGGAGSMGMGMAVSQSLSPRMSID